MSGTTTIPQNVIQAIIIIIAIDKLQLSEGSGGVGTHKWQDWHWTQAESEFWSSLRAILEPLLELYGNRNNITTAQRALVKQTIKSAREYSKYDVNGHRLFLKIAAFGDNTDWNIANIRFGTALAKDPSKAKSDSPAMLQPSITVKKNLLREMELMVRNPQTPKSSKLPKGMKFAKVYLYIGTEPPKNMNQYAFCGNASRGKLVVNFSNMNIPTETKQYAYFIARYESNKGELGEAGGMTFAEVLL